MGFSKNKVLSAVDMEAQIIKMRSQLYKISLCGSFCGQETCIFVYIHYKNIFAIFVAYVNTINSLA